MTRPLPLTDADRAAWAAHEKANRRAHEAYKAKRDRPVVVDTRAPRKKRPCRKCGKPARSASGVCRACQVAS